MATQVKTGKGFGINDLLIPQHTENLLTSTASIPEPLNKGRDIGSPTLLCTINKVQEGGGEETLIELSAVKLYIHFWEYPVYDNI